MSWGAAAGWEDRTYAAYPDWLEVRFNGPKLIDRAALFSLRDNYWHFVDEDTLFYQRFRLYGIVDFTLEGWNGSAWVPLVSVTDNQMVHRTVGFTPFVTDRVRVTSSKALMFKSRIVELEVYGIPVPSGYRNVALASEGSVATASSYYPTGGSPSALIDGRRRGPNWPYDGWEDLTQDVYPDRVEVAFLGPRTIDSVVVYTLANDYTNPADPTDATLATAYGVSSYNVEAWIAGAWQVVGTVSTNDRARSEVNFAPVTTDKVRVNVLNARLFKSRLVEIEAWGS
jgi:hypothetical protein